MSPTRHGFRALALAAALTPAAGCSEYLERRDTLSLGSGDAVQRNIALQVIDPAPARARGFERSADGSRAQRAIERYRNPPASSGESGPSGQVAASGASLGAPTVPR